VVPKADNISDDDRRQILTLFKKYLGNTMKISIEVVASLPVPPSGKSVFVINQCLQ
jgi:hypothetical protein